MIHPNVLLPVPPGGIKSIAPLNTESTEQDSDSPSAFITGGAGFIGSHLADLLLQRGHEVHVADNLSGGKVENLNSGALFHESDIRDFSLREVISDTKPAVIYHLAAQSSVSVSARNPVLDAQVNIVGTLNILDAARHLDPKPKIVYASTGGAIYGELEDEKLPASESIVPMPMSPYGVSKLAVENYLPMYQHLYGVPYTILRPANVYGPRQDPHGEAGVIAIFTQAMLEGREVKIFGDGEDERDYIFVSDFVELMASSAESNRTGPYNISSGIGVSVNEIYLKLRSIIRYAKPAIYTTPRPGDIRKISLDSSKANRELGWRCETGFDDGLEKTVDWFRSRHE